MKEETEKLRQILDETEHILEYYYRLQKVRKTLLLSYLFGFVLIFSANLLFEWSKETLNIAITVYMVVALLFIGFTHSNERSNHE